MSAPEILYAMYGRRGKRFIVEDDQSLHFKQDKYVLASTIPAMIAEAVALEIDAAWKRVRHVICSQDWTDTDGDIYCDALEAAIRARKGDANV